MAASVPPPPPVTSFSPGGHAGRGRCDRRDPSEDALLYLHEEAGVTAVARPLLVRYSDQGPLSLRRSSGWPPTHPRVVGRKDAVRGRGWLWEQPVCVTRAHSHRPHRTRAEGCGWSVVGREGGSSTHRPPPCHSTCGPRASVPPGALRRTGCLGLWDADGQDSADGGRHLRASLPRPSRVWSRFSFHTQGGAVSPAGTEKREFCMLALLPLRAQRERSQ